MRRMTRTEVLDAALKKSEQAVKLLDRAVEEVLADDVVELAERVKPSHAVFVSYLHATMVA